ncbi:MAG: hypothetical protein U0228_22490 [Myxococcaceae bacterium]
MLVPVVVSSFLAATPLSQTDSTGALTAARAFTSVATSTTGLVATWEDARQGPWWPRAFITRFDLAGNAVDVAGFPVSDAPVFQSDPSVDCIGDQCVVAWQQGHEGLRVRSFDAATGALGPITAVDTFSNAAFASPALVHDATRFYLVWTGSSGDALLATVTPAGAVGTPISVFTGGYFASPLVAIVSGVLAVAAVESNSCSVSRRLVNAASLTPAGAVVLGTTNLCFSRGGLTISATDTGFFEGWTNLANGPRGRRITATGALLDATPLSLGATGTAISLTSAWDGSGTVVSWVQDNIEVRGTRLAGAMPGPAVALMPVRSGGMAGGLYDTESLVALAPRRLLLHGWLNTFIDEPLALQLNGRFIDVDAGVLVPGADFAFRQTTEEVHDAPRLALLPDGQRVLVFGALVDSGGAPRLLWLDATGAPIGAAVQAGSAAAQFAGTDVAVIGHSVTQTWSTGDAVMAARFVARGAAAGTAPVATGFVHASAPRLAGLQGGGGLVTWLGDDGTNSGVFGRVIALDGGLQPASLLRPDTQPSGSPGVGASGTQYLVAWYGANQLRASRVSSDGAWLDGAGLSLDTQSNVLNVEVASNGADFLVVWSWGDKGGVRARRVSAAGTLLDAAPLALEAGAYTFVSSTVPMHPSVSFDGSDYVVTWVEPQGPDAGLDLFSRRVSSSGALGPVVPRVTRISDQLSPAVSARSDGELFFAWLDTTSAAGVARVWGEVAAGDGGFDAGSDAGSDAGFDGGVDGSVDGGSDGGLDGGTDGGPALDGGSEFDGGPGVDAGTDRRELIVGCGCTSADPLAVVCVVGLLTRSRRRRWSRSVSASQRGAATAA